MEQPNSSLINQDHFLSRSTHWTENLHEDLHNTPNPSKSWTAPEAFSTSARTVIWCWFLQHLPHVASWTRRYSQSGLFIGLGKPSPGPVEPEPPKRARGRLRICVTHSQFVSANLCDLSEFLPRLCLLEWFQSCLGHWDRYHSISDLRLLPQDWMNRCFGECAVPIIYLPDLVIRECSITLSFAVLIPPAPASLLSGNWAESFGGIRYPFLLFSAFKV